MFVGLVHILAVFLIVFALPIYPYKAYCSGEDIYIKGPYRDRFLILLLWSLKSYSIYTFLFQGTVYAPAFLDHKNVDWRLANRVVEGFEIDGAHFAPPERMVRLLKERGYADDGSRSMRLLDDCDLFRAAILPDEAFGESAPNSRRTMTIR